MKKRYVYALLFGVPGFLVSLLITFALFGFMAGLLWLFLFGDDTWPEYLEYLLPILFITTFLILWTACIALGYITGNRLEDGTNIDRKHVIASVTATILTISVILLYQLRVGNIGDKPVTLRCSEYCITQGYAMSSMPRRDSGEMICSCFDEYGQETVKIDIDKIDP